MSTALAPEHFEAELRALAPYYHIHHPFNRMMSAGQASHSQIRGWVANRFYYQTAIPLKDAALMANCPERGVRRLWRHRIADHDGGEGSEGGIEAWLRLGAACGLRREALWAHDHVLPGVRFAVDAYINFVRRAHWLDGVASSLTELFAPTIHRERLAHWPHYYPWIETSGLDYFRNRLGEAHRDVEHGLSLVLERCETRASQERVLEILRFKLEVLWSMLDAMHLAYVLDMPPFAAAGKGADE